jgi:hypothetical protein
LRGVAIRKLFIEMVYFSDNCKNQFYGSLALTDGYEVTNRCKISESRLFSFLSDEAKVL